MITCKFLKKQNFQFSKLVISDYPAQQKTKRFPLLEAEHLPWTSVSKRPPLFPFPWPEGWNPNRVFCKFWRKKCFLFPGLATLPLKAIYLYLPTFLFLGFYSTSGMGYFCHQYIMMCLSTFHLQTTVAYKKACFEWTKLYLLLTWFEYPPWIHRLFEDIFHQSIWVRKKYVFDQMNHVYCGWCNLT